MNNPPPEHQPPLRFAVVGCGRMGHVHTQRLHADGRGRVVALTDVDRNAAIALRSQRAPAAQVFDSLETLLRTTPLDAVILATPTTSHYEQILACHEHGVRAVLCEKPLAQSRAKILELVELAERTALRLSVGYQRRYWDTYRTLAAEVRSGRWGNILAVTSQNAERWQQTIAGTWRDDPEVNWGGFVGDAGSHKIDVVFYVTGLRPTQVYAQSRNCGSRVEIVTSVSARLADHVPLTMSFTGNSETFVEDLHIHCEHATLLLRDGNLWVSQDNILNRLPAAFANSDPTLGFVDALLSGEPFISPPACALPVFDFTQGILQSSRSGQSIALTAGAAR